MNAILLRRGLMKKDLKKSTMKYLLFTITVCRAFFTRVFFLHPIKLASGFAQF